MNPINVYAQYRKSLELLAAKAIENPTPADVAAVAPHLTLAQIEDLFARSASGQYSTYFAAPSLYVRFAYHALALINYEGETRLQWSYAHRTRESYTNSHVKGDVFTDTAYQNEAIAFANAAWGDQLVLDTWDDVGTNVVQDPTTLNKYGGPVTKFQVFWAISRDWNEIHNDHTVPEWKQWDNALVRVTTDRLEAGELKGGRGGFTEFNCAYCGYGLDLERCDGCHHHFHDDHFRCGWSTPLPPKIVEYLRDLGHTFVVAPETWWK